MIYEVDGKLELRELSAPAVPGSAPVALVQAGAINLLIDEGLIKIGELRKLATDNGLQMPEGLIEVQVSVPLPKEIDEERVAKEETRDRAEEALSFASLRSSWGALIKDTAKAVRDEFNESASPRTKDAATKVGHGIKTGSEKVTSTIKPTFVASSNKAIIVVLSGVQRNLMSLNARLVEEALTTRLDAMTSEERSEFYALFVDKMNGSTNPDTVTKLSSWNKVIRRFMH